MHRFALLTTLLLTAACSSSSPESANAEDLNQPAQPAGGSYLELTDDRYGAFEAAPNAPHLGDPAPALDLYDANGGRFRLADQEGPVLVMFYRGFW